MKKSLPKLLLISAVLLFANTASYARGTYQQPADFINEVFAGQPPETQTLSLTDELKSSIENILQHKYKGQRIRYWRNKQKTVWILNEIGKTKPITTGIVIDNNRINHIKVLVFRESRGWEVKHKFFTKQFIDASLTDSHTLDRNIDGISGATLSVRALSKQARIALLLHYSVTRS